MMSHNKKRHVDVLRAHLPQIHQRQDLLAALLDGLGDGVFEDGHAKCLRRLEVPPHRVVAPRHDHHRRSVEGVLLPRQVADSSSSLRAALRINASRSSAEPAPVLPPPDIGRLSRPPPWRRPGDRARTRPVRRLSVALYARLCALWRLLLPSRRRLARVRSSFPSLALRCCGGVCGSAAAAARRGRLAAARSAVHRMVAGGIALSACALLAYQ